MLHEIISLRRQSYGERGPSTTAQRQASASTSKSVSGPVLFITTADGTTTISGGDAVIHLTPHDSVTLVGVSKAELRADPSAFALHA